MAKEPQPDESGDPNSSVEEDDVNSHQEDQDDSDQEVEKVEVKPKKKKKVYKLTLEETENFNEKLRKRGVIYIARVPPRMTPTKIKALLSDFDEVTRVYLVEEDQTIRKRRKKEHGSSGGKRYNEGWVELASKRKAKHIAASLNNTPISNIKRNPHCGDLWNLKYLNKFKWSHLTEKVAYERRVREQKLRIEMMHARRENANYVQMVETGKKLDRIEERKRKRGEKGTPDDSKNWKHRQNKPMDGYDKAAKSAVLHSIV